MPDASIDQLMDQAVRHHRAGQFAQAEAAYRQVLARQPNHDNALNLLGVIAMQVGRPDVAVGLIRRAIEIQPAVAGFHNNLGSALRAGESFVEAAAAFRRAIQINPNFAEAYVNLSNALSDQGLFDDAVAACKNAIRLNPRFAEAYNNMGCALMDQRKMREAFDAFDKCLEMDPNHFGARYNRASVLLILGRWKEGWAQFDYRLKDPRLNLGRSFKQPQWDGVDPSGKTILLHAEGGHGDALHFIRFVPQVAARGAKLILECQPALVSLFNRFPCLDAVIARGQTLPEFDFQIPLQSLPHVLGLTLENVPNQVPYLSAPPERVQHWVKRLRGETKFRVGLVWAGAKHTGRDSRTRTIDVYSSLAQVSGVRFFSLQTGPQSTQPPPPGMDFADVTKDLTDFAETAALIENLDLVISIDTSIAHLAGALAKPVWVMIPFNSDFRWLLDRSDTPWYPTMRLFRQSTSNDWSDVCRNLAQTLAEFVAGRQ